MKKQIDHANDLRSGMDRVDQAQQDAIEAISSRMEALTYMIVVMLIVFGSTLVFLVADAAGRHP